MESVYKPQSVESLHDLQRIARKVLEIVAGNESEASKIEVFMSRKHLNLVHRLR